jgi:hypothetical protein
LADAPTLRSGTPQRQALSNHLNVRFATPGHIPGSEQKRTFTILHCEAVFNLVLKNNEPLQSFGNAKPLVNEMAAPFVHETCLYAVFEYEAMDRSL